MKTENYLLIGLLILVVTGLVFALTGFTKSEATNIAEGKAVTDIPERLGFKSITTGTTSSGDVSIELTPKSFNNGKLEVNIAANTHSVNLDQFDLMQITTLEYNGKLIKPTSAPALGGHHVSGTLVFDVGKKISSFAIKIKGIPKVQERIFDWR